jgi:hypothetical protein
MDSSSLSYSYSQESVSAAVIDQLRRTRGWVLFFSIMLWIGAVFLLLGGLAMAGMGLVAGASSAMSQELSKEFGAVGGVAAIGVIYFVLAVFYIYPALKLGKYAARIRDLAAVPSEQNLVAALNEQRAFWKYLGVFTIVMIALYFVLIAVMIVVGVAGAAAAGAMSTP